MRHDPLQRLLAKTTVRGDDECWTWNGGTDGGGHGVFRRYNALEPVHVSSHILHGGQVERGQVVMHTCNNKRCVNPRHLVAGTQKQNVQQAVADGLFHASRTLATHCGHGHEFTPDNTYIRPSGVRQCRACKAEAKRRHNDRMRGEL